MRYLSIIFVSVAIAATSCNSNNTADKTETKVAVKGPAQSTLGATGTPMMVAVVNNYYELKDALVATNAAKADAAATKLIASTAGLDSLLRTDSANMQVFKPYLDTITAQSQLISSVKDETCEMKRTYFSKISDVLFVMVQKAKLENSGIYREYCPMAFNEKGAYWLSNDAEIKNPYFGKKMLECGEVTDTLK